MTLVNRPAPGLPVSCACGNSNPMALHSIGRARVKPRPHDVPAAQGKLFDGPSTNSDLPPTAQHGQSHGNEGAAQHQYAAPALLPALPVSLLADRGAVSRVQGMSVC